MYCPYDKNHEFSEWDLDCQECPNFDHCMNIDDHNNIGENYPNYNDIHIRKLLNQSRTEYIENLILKEMPIITIDDIIDWKIDCEIYNKICRKNIIKERYPKIMKKTKKSIKKKKKNK